MENNKLQLSTFWGNNKKAIVYKTIDGYFVEYYNGNKIKETVKEMNRSAAEDHAEDYVVSQSNLLNE